MLVGINSIWALPFWVGLSLLTFFSGKTKKEFKQIALSLTQNSSLKI